MEGKGLFPIVGSGYDVREADAYIAFLLAEYNKAMERIAVLEQAQSTDKGLEEVRSERQNEELNELRGSAEELKKQLEEAAARESELEEKLKALENEKAELESRLTEQPSGPSSPTVEHTAKIIADILVQARDGGEAIVAKAKAQAEEMVQKAKEKASALEAGSIEKARHAREIVAESQRRIQEAYSFLESLPDQVSE
ncbi:MAG: hypothetical protein LBQ80_02480 [Clostridium sp.]|jgi:DNA repair exonuclease SbcCD ATPase subunit|nr:hypothetical protein [Clostridium sp.]